MRTLLSIGGYDQELTPSGGQDVDLMWRLSKMGQTYRAEGKFVGTALTNYMEEVGKKQRYKRSCEEKVRNVPAEWADKDWSEMNDMSLKIARGKLKKGLVERNEGVAIGLPLDEVEFVYPPGPVTKRVATASGGKTPGATALPMKLPTPPPSVRPMQTEEEPVFQLFTFGCQKFAGRYRRSQAAREMRNLTDTRGGRPVPVPEDLLFGPQRATAVAVAVAVAVVVVVVLLLLLLLLLQQLLLLLLLLLLPLLLLLTLVLLVMMLFVILLWIAISSLS